MLEQREYLRRKAAGEYLRDTYKFCSPSMLSKLAVIGGGPELQYVGAIPLYEKTKLDAWALSKMSPAVRSTSERDAQLRNSAVGAEKAA